MNKLKLSHFFLIPAFCFFLVQICLGQKNIKFINGHIFVQSTDTNSFSQQDFYTHDGLITFNAPGSIDTLIDLNGKYVIPPFGDAHTHNLDRQWMLKSVAPQYLKEGCYYVLNLTSKKDQVEKLRPIYEQYDTPDVKFSLQGLTSTLGHPFMAYEPFAMGLYDASKWTELRDSIRNSRLDENNAYIFIDFKLPAFFAGKPDVVKVYLCHSDRHFIEYNHQELGDNCLDPVVAEYIIKEAKKKGLKTFAHVQNRFDFEVALRSGIDCLAHLPISTYSGKIEDLGQYKIPDQLLQEAVAQNMAIFTNDSTRLDNRTKLVKEFIRNYLDEGGNLLIGSDIFAQTLSNEIKAVKKMTDLTSKELFEMLCVRTPTYIFPNRKICSIQEGYEADFLIVETNPFEDIDFTEKINLRVKRGRILN